jgi:hypothetical protein
MDYRLYLLGEENRITGVIVLDCLNDEHALQTVKERGMSVRTELWQMGSRVAIIEPSNHKYP